METFPEIEEAFDQEQAELFKIVFLFIAKVKSILPPNVPLEHYKGPTASLGDFQNPCFLGGNSRKVHENFHEKKISPLHPKAFLQYLKSLLFPRKIRKKIFIETFL